MSVCVMRFIFLVFVLGVIGPDLRLAAGQGALPGCTIVSTADEVIADIGGLDVPQKRYCVQSRCAPTRPALATLHTMAA